MTIFESKKCGENPTNLEHKEDVFSNDISLSWFNYTIVCVGDIFVGYFCLNIVDFIHNFVRFFRISIIIKSIFLLQIQAKMAIQCGICKNIMPTASFLSHKERKHSMVDRVPYVKLPDDLLKSDYSERPLVKCRFCPNRVPENAMDRHLQRCHINCKLCSKTLLKSNYEKHMQQKHGNHLMRSKIVSQSKASLQSDDDLSTSTADSSTERDPPPVPYRPPPPPASNVSCTKQTATDNSDFIRVNEWQLHNYIRQGRVYRKNGFLYLRNVDAY